MAMFRVGQRVRIVDAMVMMGREGIITSINPDDAWPGCDCVLYVPTFPDTDNCYEWSACFYQLAPLTDPLAEKFIETVKLWGPLKEKEAA
jgi:hypothetical protein